MSDARAQWSNMTHLLPVNSEKRAHIIKKYVYPIAHACTVQVEKGMCFACELYSAAAPARRARASRAYDVRSGGGSYIST